MAVGLDLAAQTDKLAKKVYSKENSKILENMNTTVYSKLKTSPKKPEGEGYVFNVGASQNQAGIKAMNEHEALATPGSDDTYQGTITPKKVTGTCQMTGLAKYALAGMEASFGNAVMQYMKNTYKETQIRLEQMIFRNGSGLIARVNGAVSASTSLTFDTGIKTHFRRGMLLDVYDSSNSTKQISGIAINGISATANTLTLASAQSCDDNGYIYLKSHKDGAPTGGKEWAGLPLVTDDGTDSATYEGITRTGSGYVDIWKGLEIDAGGANLSDDLLQRALEYQDNEGSGDALDMFIAAQAQVRKYLSYSLPMVQFDPGKNRDTGVKGQKMWQGIPILEARYCGRDEVYLLNSDSFKKYILSDLKWADEFGGTIVKWNNGYDSGIAYCRILGNYGSESPRGVIRIHTLATPTI